MCFSIFQNTYLKIKWSYKKLYFMIRFNKKNVFSTYLVYTNVVLALKPSILSGHNLARVTLPYLRELQWSSCSGAPLQAGPRGL